MRKISPLFLLVAACGGGGTVAEGFDDQEIVVDFADSVVVPTYAALDERMAALDVAADALVADPSDANLEAARAAWVATREPWEQSEGFLFGPVDSYGFDPALDSWPVNTTDLEAVLASNDALTQEYVANLQETQKGFHTIEYIVYGEGGTRTAADLDARELEYLAALTEEASRITGQLHAAWTDGIEGQGPYRDVLATAGEDGNTAFPSRRAAAQQILTAMSGICEEVATGKIAGPYDAHDPNLVESQFSFNSLIDFTDNIVSVRNCWTGDSDVGGTTGKGLDEYVADLDPDLKARVDAEIQAAIDALAAVPPPFPEAIQNPDAYDEIEAAQQAISALQATIDGDLSALVLE
jgi:predicted lipoprotein